MVVVLLLIGRLKFWIFHVKIVEVVQKAPRVQKALRVQKAHILVDVVVTLLQDVVLTHHLLIDQKALRVQKALKALRVQKARKALRVQKALHVTCHTIHP